MPKKTVVQRAKRKRAQGMAPTTQAGEFVREEMRHIRKGRHGAKNPKQAIAIALSKARKAGVALPHPPAGTPSARKEKRAQKQARSVARRRGPAAPRRSALKAARTRSRRAA